MRPRIPSLAQRPRLSALLPRTPPRRTLRIAPPYLLDTHTPKHQLLPSAQAAQKRSAAYAHLQACNLCPRRCNTNRLTHTPTCLIKGNVVRTATIAPHRGEEPCIQGANGSGAVFFSGCNLRCVFCQNHDVAHTNKGFELTPEELAGWMVKLQDVGGVHNINLVTPEHVVPQIVLAILAARDMGLALPIVYNTSAYDSPESIELLDGLVDVYMPDFKVWSPATSRRLLKADDYAAAARESIRAMHAQVGDLCFTSDGLAKSGVLVRHLVMPGGVDEGAEIMRWLGGVSKDMVVHVMEQYHPRAHVGKARRTTKKSANAGTQAADGSQATNETTAPDVIEPGGVPASEEAKAQVLRYAEINRPVSESEVDRVKAAARSAGLWRFIEPAEHGAFFT